jgi:hypothetical protein
MGSIWTGRNAQTGEIRIPDWVESRARNALDIADEISRRPFQTYGNQRIAGFTPDQRQAFSQIRQSQGQFMPQMGRSMDSLSSIQTGSVPMIGGGRSQPVVDAGMKARGGTIGMEFNPQFRALAGFGDEGVSNLRAGDRVIEAGRNLGIGEGDINRLSRMMVPGGGQAAIDWQAVDRDRGADQAPVMNPPALGLVRPPDRLPVLPPNPQPVTPTLDQAQAGLTLASATSLDPTSIERVRAERFYDAPVERYMNPYLSQALEPTLREIRRQNDIAAQRDMARATAAGAFGGGRHGIIDAERERNTQQLIADTIARGYSGAYQSASERVAADQARELQAAQGNQQFGNQARFRNQDAANQFALANMAAGNEMARFNTGLRQQSTLANLDAIMRQREQAIAAARTGSDVAQAGQAMNLRDIQALMGIGERQQASDQANMNLAYEDFLREQNYPQEQLNLLLSALQGTPYGRTTYGPGPSAGGQGIGALLALLGGGMRLAA